MAVIVTPLVSMMKDNVEELSNLGLKPFAIGTGDKEGLTEGSTSVSNRTGITAAIPCFLRTLPTNNKVFLGSL